MEFVNDWDYRVTSFDYDDGKIIFDKETFKEPVITLEDIIRLSVVTTDDGPWIEDTFWFVETKSSKYIIPIDDVMPGSGFFLHLFQTLPDFDNDTFIKAMSSTDLAEFLVWERK